MPRRAKEKEFIHFDCFPPREVFFTGTEEKLSTLAKFYGFERIRTSPIEDAREFSQLTKAGLLDERPPVICKTRSGTALLLRPSGALGTLRAYVTHKMNDLPHPLKFFFQGEGYHAAHGKNPRVRCIPEWGLVMIGEEGPVAEAEVIQVMWRALGELGFDMTHVELRVNATGCSECRPAFRSAFMPYLRGRAQRLCKNCKKHLKSQPMRILICGEDQCRMVANHTPQVLDFLCEVCKKHLRGFLEFLDEAEIPYFLDPKFFRDGSWYASFLFEFLPLYEAEQSEAAGEEAPVVRRGNTIAEGGRMSRAGELIAGKRLDVVAGIVLLNALVNVRTSKEGDVAASSEKPKVFLAHLGELAKRKSLGILETLRAGGISARESLGRDSVKSQLKVAERLGAEVALILGQKEALDGTIIVREVDSGIQETIPQDKLIEFLKKKLKASPKS